MKESKYDCMDKTENDITQRLDRCASSLSEITSISKEDTLSHLYTIVDCYIEPDLYLMEKLAEEYNKLLPEHHDDISTLKKRIKYCKNPLEKKNLQRELNAAYRKRRKSNDQKDFGSS